ncbi:MAG: hypothetical protein ACKONH_10780 [Planctomycetia bacterium]
MRTLHRLVLPAVALLVAITATPGAAISPRNPYRSFNLSGVNYGSMQWERAQREGRSVWPSSSTTGRSSGVWVAGGTGGGAGAGAIVTAGGSRTNPRPLRRWRR